MMRFITWLLALPIGAAIVALAVANRRSVTLALDPIRPDDPLVSVSLPLFVLVLGALMLGVLLGGVSVWWGQRVYRRAARAQRREVARLESERARLAAEVGARQGVVAGLALPAPVTSSRAA